MKYAPQILFLLVLLGTPCALNAELVRLDNFPGGLGAQLDETNAASTPITFTNFSSYGSGLTITVHEITGNPGSDLDANATGVSLGVNSQGTTGDDNDQFDSGLNESMTFSFGGTVLTDPMSFVRVTTLDFVTFDSGETFNFGGTTINFGDLSNDTSDFFAFGSAFLLAADSQFTIEATSGTIGIEAFDITVVPEPTSALLFGTVLVFSPASKSSAKQLSDPNGVFG